MKTNLSFKIFVLVFCFSFIILTISAQNKPQALKFDEFEVLKNQFYSSYGKITVSQRAERFAKQLRKVREAKAYIIYYQPQISESLREIQYLANRFRDSFISESFGYDDVIILNGGHRENAAFEFWIAPKNAETPKPTPTFAESETFVCPNVLISNETPFNQTETVVFSIPSYYFKEIANHKLTWRVSAGEIVEGQGLDFIKVKLNGSVPKRLVAFLEVEGLPLPCRKTFSAIAEIGGKLFLFDSFGLVTSGEMRARLDGFLMSLQNNSAAKGYVIIYGNRAQGNRSLEARLRLISNHFAFRNFDLSQIIIMRGGFREEISSEFWLSFDENEKPVPTPTVDKKFIEVPKPTRKPRPK